MARKKQNDRVRICLDCNLMKHSRDDWECGRCLYDEHKIDHINNHDWCKHWSRIRYADEDDYPSDGDVTEINIDFI